MLTIIISWRKISPMTSRFSMLTATVLVSAAVLTGCSASEQPSSGSTTSSTASTKPAEKVYQVVTSTQTIADIVQAIIPADEQDRISITPLIASADIDPHDFELSPKDAATANQVDLVVVNGGGYDTWLSDVVSGPQVVHMLELTAGHDHEDSHEHEGEATHEHEAAEVNPHAWFNPEAVEHLVSEVAAVLQQAGFNPDTSTVTEKMTGYKNRLAALPVHTVAATEPVAEYLIKQTTWTDKTPAAYQEAALKESEPAAAAVAEFTALLDSRGVDVLLVNPQAETQTAQSLAERAEAQGIKTIAIGETPTGNFFTWYDQIVTEFEQVQ